MQVMQEICIQGRFVKKLTKKVKANLWTLNLIALNSESQKIVRQMGISDDHLVKIGGIDLPSAPGIDVKYYGMFKVNGLFACSRFEYIEPKGEQSLIKLLSSGAFKGIGRKTATDLVSAFGMRTLELLNQGKINEIEAVIGKKKAILVDSGYQKIRGLADLQVYLMSFGVSTPTISKIWDEFGSQALDKAKTNPFELMCVEGFGFTSANKIAESLGMDVNNPLRIKETIYYSLTNLLLYSSGDLYQMKNDVVKEAEIWLGNNNRAKIEEQIEVLAKEGRIAIRSKNLLYPMFNEKAEYYTCQCALDLNEVKVEKSIQKLVREEIVVYNKRYKKTLSEKQLQAVNKSLCNKFSIITGGPGTGKTTIIQAIIQIFKNIYGSEEPVILLAPTGKAAQRMTEVCKIPASTIHSRLCIYDQNQKETATLPKGLVIVDESSMVDMFLAEKLFKAVEIGSYLLFVGDIDQLPSVGAGQVLNDFIESGAIPVSRLTETFRQKEGSLIIENAQRINKGDTKLEYGNDFVFNKVKDEDEAINEVVKLYLEESQRIGEDNVCILCPRRRMTEKKLKVTTEYLNIIIQDKVNPYDDKMAVFEQETDKKIIQFRIGSRVMQTKNNADTSNGDIGIIVDITGAVEIEWDSGARTLEDADGMKTIVLGYCLTVHKSQGSEYQTVIIPMISNQKCQLFKRNLLYTAVTRAKKKVIIVSDEDKDKKNSLMDYCIINSDKNKRKTLFSLRLSTNKEKRG